MNLMFLVGYFPPEVGAASHLFYELASGLSDMGHKATVVTGFPRYNVQDPGAKKKYGWRFFMRERMDEIRVIRIRTIPFPRQVPILRGLEQFAMAFSLLVGGIMSSSQDAVLIYSPPLTLGISAYILSRLKGMAFGVNVQDLFPKSAVAIGILRSRGITRLFESMEKFVYRKADFITTHSPSAREHILSFGVNPEKVKLVHNWVDTSRIRPGERKNSFALQNGLVGKFVVSYAGTMGWAQDTRTVIEAASALRDKGDILFLLVGDGLEKRDAEMESRRRSLRNIRFMPMQPWEVYPEILASSDVGLVNLKKTLTSPTIPSKMFNIMASARPVVASVPDGGDAAQVVKESGAGICVSSGDSKGLAKAILYLYENRDAGEEMGKRGRAYVESHAVKETCLKKYEEIFTRKAGHSGQRQILHQGKESEVA